MKTAEFNEMLHSKRISVFTLGDASRLIGKPRRYASLFLSRDKAVRMAGRGLYYTDDATEYEVASATLVPSYISLISALRFHNLTEQIPNIMYLVSYKRHRPLPNIDGYRLEFIAVKKSMFYGYEKSDGAMVAAPEKAVLDMLYLRRFVEYADEAIESGGVDKRRLMAYAIMSRDEKLVHEVRGRLSGRVVR